MAGPARLVFVAALAASPFAMHAALYNIRLLPLAALAGALQGYAAGRALSLPSARWIAPALALALPSCVLCFSSTALMAWPGVLNAMIYYALLSRFARSLAPGREPLITHVARLTRGTLTPDIERYTRWVTFAWCVFFAGQLALSALFLAILPQLQWLWFVTLCNLPLAVTMFLGEYAVRLIVLRHHRHEGLAGMARAFGAVRAEFARDRSS
jgi:uncharacterized membrane protein